MLRSTAAPSYVLLSVFLLAVVGCDENPTDDGGDDTTNFQGSWTLVSTLVQKRACTTGEFNETQVEGFTLSQLGDEVTLDFGDYIATGSASESSFEASGTLPGGETIQFEFSKDGKNLTGTVSTEGVDCSELRNSIAKPRIGDSNFSGHWHFDLSVKAPGGCSFLDDYSDCFRILQTGRDLLVVDDEGGNLIGRVTGDVAEIERQTEDEITWLLFNINASEDALTGDAFRKFPQAACRTDLKFVGAVSEEPCALVNP